MIDVEISYDVSELRATYRDSENLDYRVRRGMAFIHPKYNHFVALLLQDIVAEVTL